MIKEEGLKKLSIIWLICFFIAAFYLSTTHFKSESNDSKYYSELVVRYEHSPLSEILSPKWGENYWSFDKNSYMRDQLPGQLLMGVALTKLGIPAEHALHILGMLFQILSFLLMAELVKFYYLKPGSYFVLLSLLLSPLAFSYNIRANHELGIMFFSTLALFSGFKFKFSKMWLMPATLSCSALMLIKGPFFIFGLILFTIGFLLSSKIDNMFFLKLILALIICLLSVALSGALYEFLFIKITGQSFFREFWHIQIEQRALEKGNEHSFIIQKFLNFYYYFSHYLVYALPWSFILILLLLMKKSFHSFFHFIKSKGSLLFILSALSFCFIFSLSNRIAGRYTFPGYFLFVAWVSDSLYSLSPQLAKKMAPHQATFDVLIPFIWLFSFSLHFLPFLKH